MASPQYQHKNIIITQTMLNALQTLADQQWHALSAFRPRTINGLIQRDLITLSIEFKRYRLTTRGIAFLAYLEQRTLPRTDGRCPHCDGLRERHKAKNGYVYNLCYECLTAYRLSKAPAKVKTYLCPRCKTNKKRVYRGKVLPYCKDCQYEVNKHANEAYNQRTLERLASGEVLLCIECGSAPRHITSGGNVRSRCKECQCKRNTALNRAWRRRKKHS